MAKIYSNQWRGIGVLAALTALICTALWFLSYEEGAGTASFKISLAVVLAESILILVPYYRWYRSVSDAAAGMYNLKEMQIMSRRRAFKAQKKLLILSFIAGGAGTVLVLIGILFSGISSIFSYSAVLGGLMAGNFLFYLLTHRIFLPNRIIGKC